MSQHVTTVDVETPLFEVLRTLNDFSIRRVPVLKQGQLSGIVSKSDFYRWVDTLDLRMTLSTEEWSTRPVAELMVKDPWTCKPEDPIEKVGEFMRKRKIGCLPVLHDRQLVGIITESDLFAALLKVSGWGTESTRLCLQVKRSEHREVFSEILNLAGECSVQIDTVLKHSLGDGEHDLVLLRVQGPKIEEFKERVWRLHYLILQVS